MKAGTRHAGWFMAGATAAALGLLSPVAWAQPKPPQEVYTCIDKTGRRITADRPIADCVDREQRILDHTGAERRRIGPTLTEHEHAARRARRPARGRG